MSDLVGKKILHYRILEKLGEGGMGVVYLAEDTKLERQVAIKFLPHHISKNSDERKRFEIEAKAAATLNHPNIATIHAIEEADDYYFIVMEYIRGKHLKDHISSKPLSITESIDIAIQTAKGLQEAHNKRVIHRDIKSTNIMSNEKGEVKIMDFGLARIGIGVQLTKEQSTLGTAAYMSPEQAKGEAVDVRTDIWSFGVVFYEMLTGTMPFMGDYEQAIIYSILNEEPDYSGIPVNLRPVLQKLMARNPEDRYSGLNKFIDDLDKEIFLKNDNPKNEKAINPVKKIVTIPIALIILSGLLYYLNLFIFHNGKEVGVLKRIAVLPFKNLNGDSSQEYFSDGMTVTIISDLANIKGLSVISGTSTMPYKNSSQTIKEIGLDLKVTHILEGSVLTSGDKVRIFSQLIDIHTETHVWAQTYDREMKDIFSIQTDVANNIASILELSLAEKIRNRINDRPTSNLEAYRLFLKAQFYFNKAGFEDLDSAIVLFDKAVKLDPNFAMAHAELSRTYILKNVQYDLEPNWKEKSYISFQEALSLDSELAEAYVARATWYWSPDNGFKHEMAIQDLQKAIQLKPGLSAAYELLALVQLHVGLFEKAMKNSQKALELEPTSMWF
jgi:serine/threonine protein kinase/Tfp pilus assembly protein PilF